MGRASMRMGMSRISIWAGILVFVFAVVPASADTLEKKDGSVMEGRVIAETSDVVTFEVSNGGITFRQRVPRAQVRAVRREVREGPGFCTIPLVGEIGAEVKADDFRDALAAARRGGAEYVVLVIDSPGGSIDERNKILAVMVQTKDLKLIAYVKRALSAAAVLAVACPQICMAPDASIGAAVAFKIGPKGMPEDIEEKFRSAIRAGERAAAAMGDRSDLWIRGMSELNLELSLVQADDGRPRLVEGLDAPDAKPVKKKGEILTLTAKEALASGLSSATITDVSFIRDSLGLKAWHDTGDQAWSIMANRAVALKGRAEATRARNAYFLVIQPEIVEMSGRAERAVAKASAAHSALGQLHAQYDNEVRAINAEYEQAIAQSPDSQALKASSAQNANKRLSNLRARMDPEIRRYQAVFNEAAAEVKMMVGRRDALLASMPPGE
jgi:ATP-dependent protease ClpP protease subunit